MGSTRRNAWLRRGLAALAALTLWVLWTVVEPSNLLGLPAALADVLMAACAYVLWQAVGDRIGMIGTSRPLLMDQRLRLYRYPLLWLMGGLMAFITVLMALTGGPGTYNDEPYVGPAWPFLLWAPIVYLLVGHFGGVRVRLTKEHLVLRSAFWPPTQLSRAEISEVVVTDRRATWWNSGWGLFFRMDAMIPLMPRDFSVGGVAKVTVRLRNGRQYRVGAREPDWFVATLLTRDATSQTPQPAGEFAPTRGT